MLYGCATYPVEPTIERPRGDVVVRAGRAGFVVAAPHAGSETGSGEVAAEIARRTGFGLVVATGVGVAPDAYEQRVRDAAQGPVRFYVEIDGDHRGETAGRMEIATVGIDQDVALRFRTLLELVRDAHLRAAPQAPRLEVRVEPADPVVYAASRAQRVAMLRVPERALHIELPGSARTEFRQLYTAILADFVGQAVTLPRPR